MQRVQYELNCYDFCSLLFTNLPLNRDLLDISAPCWQSDINVLTRVCELKQSLAGAERISVTVIQEDFLRSLPPSLNWSSFCARANLKPQEMGEFKCLSLPPLQGEALLVIHCAEMFKSRDGQNRVGMGKIWPMGYFWPGEGVISTPWGRICYQ